MQRESYIPLLVGAAVAIVLHVLVVPLSARALLSAPSFGFDLSILGIEAPRQADAGDAIPVTVSVHNRGPRGTGAAASGQVYLSADDRLSADDVLLAALDFDEPQAGAGGDPHVAQPRCRAAPVARCT